MRVRLDHGLLAVPQALSATYFTLSPASSSSVACVYRRSWNRIASTLRACDNPLCCNPRHQTKRGLTQEQLAQPCGRSERWLRYVEADQAPVYRDVAQRLAAVLHVDTRTQQLWRA